MRPRPPPCSQMLCEPGWLFFSEYEGGTRTKFEYLASSMTMLYVLFCSLNFFTNFFFFSLLDDDDDHHHRCLLLMSFCPPPSPSNVRRGWVVLFFKSPLTTTNTHNAHPTPSQSRGGLFFDCTHLVLPRLGLSNRQHHHHHQSATTSMGGNFSPPTPNRRSIWSYFRPPSTTSSDFRALQHTFQPVSSI